MLASYRLYSADVRHAKLNVVMSSPLRRNGKSSSVLLFCHLAMLCSQRVEVCNLA